MIRAIHGPVREADRYRRITDYRRRRNAVGDCCRIHNRLERRPGLTLPIDGSVELGLEVIAATYERANITRRWSHRDHQPLQILRFSSLSCRGGMTITLTRLDLGDTLGQRDSCRCLKRGIEGSVDPVTTLIDGDSGALRL